MKCRWFLNSCDNHPHYRSQRAFKLGLGDLKLIGCGGLILLIPEQFKHVLTVCYFL